MPIWSPDVSHPLLIDSAADEELIVPPRSTAAAERPFRYANALRGLTIVLPDSDETFGEKKKQGCEDGLILSGEFPSFEDVVIVIPGSHRGFTMRILEQIGGTHTRSRSCATKQ